MQGDFMHRYLTHILLPVALASTTLAGPPSREQSDHQNQVIADLKKSLESKTDDAARFAAITQTLSNEPEVELRRRILTLAASISAPDRETFLITRLAEEQD